MLNSTWKPSFRTNTKLKFITKSQNLIEIETEEKCKCILPWWALCKLADQSKMSVV